MGSVSDPAAEIFDIVLLITVVGAGITAALAFLMGVITALRGLRGTDQARSLKSAAVMFLIVSADCLVLWALSDLWGNDEPVAAITAAVGFGLLALAMWRVSQDRQKALSDLSTGQSDSDDDYTDDSQEGNDG